MKTSALDDNPIVETSRSLPLQNNYSKSPEQSPSPDCEVPTLIHRWHHDYSILSTVAFPERDLLFCGTQDHLILVFDMHTYERKLILKGHTGSVLCLTRSQDEKFLFSGGSDSLVKVWDVETMKETHTIYSLVDIGDIFSLVWSQSLNTVFFGCQNASILFVHLLDTQPKNDPSYLPSQRFDKFFDSAGPTGDTNCTSKKIQVESRLIEVPSSNILRYAHNGFIYTMKIYENYLISGAGDGLIKLWDLTKDLKLIKELDNEDSVLSMTLNDAFLYSGLTNGKLKLWDLNTFQQLLTFHSDSVNDSHDDISTLCATRNYLFKGSKGGVTKWKFGTDLKLFWKAHDGLVLSSEIVYKNHKVLLITGGNDASLAIWDITFDHDVNPRKNSSISLNLNLDNDSLLSTLSDLVAFKTVSKNPEIFIDDSRHCANYLKRLFKKFGGESQLIPVENGNPIVYGCFRSNKPNASRALWYGHYDIIEANDKCGWDFDPFTMTANDGFLFARGVSDNKGPILASIYSVAELYQSGELQCDVVFLIEGEEECGSFGFQDTIVKNSKMIGDIDWILLSNSYWLDENTPCLNYGLRGVISASVSISSDRPDRHSGVDGGVAREPTIELIRLLSKLTDDEGKVSIPNFYNPILPLSDEENKIYDDIIKNLSKNNEDIKKSTLLAKWKFPSLTIHKIDVSGPKNNTVIPKSCNASVSIRIVPEQDIEEIKSSFLNYLTENFNKIKSDNHLEIKFIHEADAWLGDPSNEVYQILQNEVFKEWGIKPLLIREGGSIPSVRFLEKVFNAQAAQIPCGQSTDNAHLNNEKLRIKNLFKLRNILTKTFQQLPKRE